MKLVRIHGERQLSVDEVAAPEPGPNDVVVRMKACGICGSDVHFYRAGFLRPGGEPFPLGHEGAGVIEAMGSDVKGYTVGQRVFINSVYDDGEVIGNGGREGMFGDLILVRNAKPGVQLYPIPEGLSYAHAAIAEPFAVALHGVNRGEVNPGTRAAVFGAGPIGLAGIVWLKRRGVASVVSVDISDERLAYARELGADATINPKTENLFDRLRELHGDGGDVMAEPTVGTDVFFDMAGGPTVISDIFKVAKMHSRLVITAVYPKPISFDLIGILMKELHITTAGGYPTELIDSLTEMPEIEAALRERYITHSFPFDRFEEAFEVAQRPDSGKVMIEFA